MDESRIPEHLKGKPRVCPQAKCKSTELKFGYYANKDVNQPRLQCRVCKKYFTLGGSFRGASAGNATEELQNQASEAESGDVGADEGAVQGNEAATNRALNITLPSGQALSPEPEVTPAQVDVPHPGDGRPSVMVELDDTIRDKYNGKHPFEVVRDIIKTNLLHAHNILVHVDLEKDSKSRKLSRVRRDEGAEILRKVKEILHDDLRGVEVVGEDMATRSVAMEEVFQGIETMRGQAESLDLGRISVYKLHLLRKKAEFKKLCDGIHTFRLFFEEEKIVAAIKFCDM